MNDYGCDPLGDGRFRMVPSGDVVDGVEKRRRLGSRAVVRNEILGMSWDELERRQGGRLNRTPENRKAAETRESESE